MRNSIVSLNAEADVWASQLNSGYIKFYDGTKPATPETAITTQNMLVSLSFAATAFDSAVNGVVTIPAAINATITIGGTTTWARLYKADGSTVVVDADVGAISSGNDVEIETVILSADDILQLDTFGYTRPAA